MDTALTFFDIGALAACISILFAYHFFFYFRTVRVDGNMQLSFNIRNASHWLHKHKEKSDPQTTTLAVQTLRNTIMVGIFVGGNALNFAYTITASYSPDSHERIQVRSIILSILLFCSFLCWANVIRHASHLGYLVGTLDFEDTTDLNILEHIPGPRKKGHLSVSQIDVVTGNVDDMEKGIDVSPRTRHRVELYKHDRKVVIKKAEHLLQRMMLYFSLGFRFLFVSIPFAFYASGPLALVIATVTIVIFSYNYDYNSFGGEKGQGGGM